MQIILPLKKIPAQVVLSKSTGTWGWGLQGWTFLIGQVLEAIPSAIVQYQLLQTSLFFVYCASTHVTDGLMTQSGLYWAFKLRTKPSGHCPSVAQIMTSVHRLIRCHHYCIISHKINWHNSPNFHRLLVCSGNADNNMLKESFSFLKSSSWALKFRALWVEMWLK